MWWFDNILVVMGFKKCICWIILLLFLYKFLFLFLEWIVKFFNNIGKCYFKILGFVKWELVMWVCIVLVLLKFVFVLEFL